MNKTKHRLTNSTSPPSRRSHSLRWQLLNLLEMILLLTLLAIGMSVFYFIFQNEQHTWQGRQGEAARHAGETVTTFIQHMREALILTSLPKRDFLVAEPWMLDNSLQQNPAFLEIIRLDSDGKVFAAAYRDAPLLANLFTIPQSRWFIESKAGRLYLSDVQISSTSEPYLIMSIPAPDGGVVTARIHLDVLWNVIDALRFGETGQAYVVNQEGQIIAHTEAAVALANTSLAGRPEMAALLQAPNYEWSGSYVNFKGSEVLGVTAPVSETEWVVFTEITKLESFAVSRTAVLLLGGGLAFFGLLVMLVTSRFLGQLIIRPMEQLRAGAARLGQGDLSHQIELDRQDEVGEVASAFNEMALKLRDREDYITKAAALAAEVAERKRIEETLTRARDQALEASRLKTELLAKVSHELRTPLGAILGYTEMLELEIYGPLSEEQRAITSEVIDSTQYLSNMVVELLDQAQLESGKLKLHITSFTPADIVDGVLSKTNVLAQTKGLALTTDITADLPDSLSGDLTRLQQILVNLVDNALKFTQTGAVQMRLFRPNALNWALQVSDTGPGIPAADQAYIFDPFRQVDGSITRKHAGTGLGLSIVKQLTTLMGGQITLESEVGQGSTFTIILPLQPVEEKSVSSQ